MKKILCGIIALLVCMTAAGCGEKSGEEQIDVMIWDESAESVRFEDTSDIVPKDENNINEQTDEPIAAVYTSEEISGYFNSAFLKETAKQKDNFAVSPLSVKIALNMAALGAKNDTEKELLTIFGYENQEQMQEESQNAISELDREDGSITVNNSVWVSDIEDFKISDDYIGKMGDIFGAEFFRKNLSDENIVGEFNGWINEKTNGLIPQIISKPFDEDARALLVNTLYFNNEWVYELNPMFEGYTMTFYGINGECQANGMSMEHDDILYAEGDIFKSVSLAYKDGSHMNIYLPVSETENVFGIAEKLSPAELSAAFDLEYGEKKVYVFMPRFECEYNESLKDMLMRLGVLEAFEADAADFSGMLDESSEYPVFISDVIHASKIKCGEKGTEAVAATVVEAAATALIPETLPIEFIVNRPFIYEIKSPSGETLFMGIISSF